MEEVTRVAPVPERAAARTAAAVLAALGAPDLPVRRAAPIATGFRPLDEVLGGGVRAGELLLLGGKPGQGKTVAALQWARNAALTGSTAIMACYEHDEVTLLARLLACELGDAAEAASGDQVGSLDDARQALRALADGVRGFEDVLHSNPLLRAAADRLESYAENLVLVGAGSGTDLAVLEGVIEQHGGEQTVLFVDYLQKVPVIPEAENESERVTRVVEGLHDLALRRGVAVVAVVAADRSGLTARRLRPHHLRGSTALAYESDIVIMLNDKVTAVSRAHLAYDSTRVKEFREYVVFSIEKQRGGVADVDLEFRKDFANSRFQPVGRWVAERLWSEGAVEE